MAAHKRSRASDGFSIASLREFLISRFISGEVSGEPSQKLSTGEPGSLCRSPSLSDLPVISTVFPPVEVCSACRAALPVPVSRTSGPALPQQGG